MRMCMHIYVGSHTSITELAELDEVLKPWCHHDAPGRRQVKSDGDDDRFTIKWVSCFCTLAQTIPRFTHVIIVVIDALEFSIRLARSDFRTRSLFGTQRGSRICSASPIGYLDTTSREHITPWPSMRTEKIL